MTWLIHPSIHCSLYLRGGYEGGRWMGVQEKTLLQHICLPKSSGQSGAQGEPRLGPGLDLSGAPHPHPVLF